MKRSVYWIIVFALCACGTSAPAEDNILLNPGFEEGGKSPTHWLEGRKIEGVDSVRDKGNGYKSKASLCLHKTAKRYFPIHSSDGAQPPKGGYKLLIVLAGGDGSEAFHPFVKRIYEHGLPRGYLLAQLVAVKWTPNQQIVWPQEKNRVPKMKFSTEEFIESVIADINLDFPDGLLDLWII